LPFHSFSPEVGKQKGWQNACPSFRLPTGVRLVTNQQNKKIFLGDKEMSTGIQSTATPRFVNFWGKVLKGVKITGLVYLIMVALGILPTIPQVFNKAVDGVKRVLSLRKDMTFINNDGMNVIIVLKEGVGVLTAKQTEAADPAKGKIDEAIKALNNAITKLSAKPVVQEQVCDDIVAAVQHLYDGGIKDAATNLQKLLTVMKEEMDKKGEKFDPRVYIPAK
jgi:hypothetical protein